MRSWSSITSNSRASSKALLIAALVLAAGQALADVCVWRDPEKTMATIFPQARDYRSVVRTIGPDQLRRIEQRVGAPLDPSERNEWGSYEILDGDGRVLGRIIACAQTGEYGAIETVMGVTPEGRVVGVYIQRTRERVSKSLKSREFLAQFENKTVGEPLKVGDDIAAVAGGHQASEAVALAVKKMLVLYDELH